MSVEVITQVVTLVLAVLAIIWHQQRTTDKLRDELIHTSDKLRDETNNAINKLRDETNNAINKLRDETNNAINKLRDELTQAISSLRDEVIGNGLRIARIEGFLGIGTPSDAAASKPSPPEPTDIPPSTETDPAIETTAGA